jgi:glycosyltransferase involved in cell wall biosynthesis
MAGYSVMRIGIVVPHIFMQQDILPHVIFSPASLAIDLAEGLESLGNDVVLYTPGKVVTSVSNITADLSYFERELEGRGDTYLDLLKKHPVTFVALARQVQSELIAEAYRAANEGELDVVHIYTNEEDIALPFVQFCNKPVVFTHHDPFRLFVKYKSVFPKYPHLNWVSMSYAQRKDMPEATNWVANIYHGIPQAQFKPLEHPTRNYVAYLGRIIQPKGVHLAIAAVKQYNAMDPVEPLTLRIAGKHYAGASKDSYWTTEIEPYLGDPQIEYLGHLRTTEEKQAFLGNASAVIMPSLFEEPFGMVSIEALACGTPVIGLDSGAIPEVIKDGQTGLVVEKGAEESITTTRLANALGQIDGIKRTDCRRDFEARFTTKHMCKEHATLYSRLVDKL